MKLWRAWTSLAALSLRRLAWSINTLMVVFPLVACALFVMRRGYHRIGDEEQAIRFFSEFVIFVFLSFITPICALAFGSTSVGGDREERTLVFLLIRPIPRPLVLLAKYVATLPLVFGMVFGSLLVYCLLAGKVGMEAGLQYAPAIGLVAWAYVSVFHLFAVFFRHATMLALFYALFFELLLGNMPGIVKRMTLNYYGRSMIYAVGERWGVDPPPIFEPMNWLEAAIWLVGIAVGALAVAVVVFQRREYRDLT